MAATPRQRPTKGSPRETVDPRTSDTPAQDIAPTEEDIRLEAAQVERRQHTTNLADWSEAGNRLQQGGNIGTPERAEDEDEEDEEDEDEDEDDEDELDEEDEEDDEDEEDEDEEETSS